MSVLTLPVVELVDETTDDDAAHIVCCDPNRALCGADVSDDTYTDDPVDEERDCEACVNKDRLRVPCGAPFCGLRCAWARYRS